MKVTKKIDAGVKSGAIVREPVPPTFTARDRRSMKDFNPGIFFSLAFPPCPPWFNI
jgi:hypothetical protein